MGIIGNAKARVLAFAPSAASPPLQGDQQSNGHDKDNQQGRQLAQLFDRLRSRRSALGEMALGIAAFDRLRNRLGRALHELTLGVLAWGGDCRRGHTC
jgi:hypothetical protein